MFKHEYPYMYETKNVVHSYGKDQKIGEKFARVIKQRLTQIAADKSANLAHVCIYANILTVLWAEYKINENSFLRIMEAYLDRNYREDLEGKLLDVHEQVENELRDQLYAKICDFLLEKVSEINSKKMSQKLNNQQSQIKPTENEQSQIKPTENEQSQTKATENRFLKTLSLFANWLVPESHLLQGGRIINDLSQKQTLKNTSPEKKLTGKEGTVYPSQQGKAIIPTDKIMCYLENNLFNFLICYPQYEIYGSNGELDLSAICKAIREPFTNKADNERETRNQISDDEILAFYINEINNNIMVEFESKTLYARSNPRDVANNIGEFVEFKPSSTWENEANIAESVNSGQRFGK